MNFLNRVRMGCFLRPKRFLPIIDFIWSLSPIRDLLDLSLCGEMECLIVYSLLNETMLKIFRDYRVSFNFEWISSDLRETCVRCIYVRELFFIFLVNYYLQNNNFDDLDFF